MKKLLLALVFLTYSIYGYADIISFDQFTGATTIADLNTAVNRIYIDHNGNITTANIKDDTIAESDLADAINPRVRDYELVGDITYSGMLPPTSASLSSTTTAGVSYVNGYRVQKDATAHTYTASKDTWLYIGQNGDYKYTEVANGAAQPTTDSGYLLLAKVVTNGATVASVTDYRITAPTNLRIYEDYKVGLAVSRDVGSAGKVIISRGEIEFGNTTGKLRRNTVSGFADLTASGRGGLDTGSMAANTYYYIHAVSDDANAVNIDFIASASSTDATGVDGERLIGWCYAQTTNIVSPDSVGSYLGRGGDSPNVISINQRSVKRSMASGVLMNIHPQIKFFSSGRPVEVKYHLEVDQTSSTGEVQGYIALSADSAGVQEQTIRTNDSGSFEASGVWSSKDLGEGTHTFDVKLLPNSTLQLNAYNISVEEK